jgi:hypothetical protein
MGNIWEKSYSKDQDEKYSKNLGKLMGFHGKFTVLRSEP